MIQDLLIMHGASFVLWEDCTYKSPGHHVVSGWLRVAPFGGSFGLHTQWWSVWLLKCWFNVCANVRFHSVEL